MFIDETFCAETKKNFCSLEFFTEQKAATNFIHLILFQLLGKPFVLGHLNRTRDGAVSPFPDSTVCKAERTYLTE